MSKYTITIRNLLDNDYELFDFDYPIFDEDYRNVLQQKIIDRYYFREIGLETPGQFKHYLKMRLNEIMPYYNQLYKSEGIMNKKDFNPLYNLDTTETQTRTVSQETEASQTGTNSSSSESTGKNIFQDTPQNKLGNTTDYATNITDDENNLSSTESGQSSTQGQANTTEEYISKVMGSGGLRYPAEIIMEWRKSFLNIDVQILDNLNDLFMGVY